MDANLIIDDIYVQEVGRLSNVRGKKLEEIMDSYISILTEIEADSITEGEISKGIASFKECVALLNDKISAISETIETACNSFIIDINNADDYLF